MGTSGPDIFDDDVAWDVRAALQAALETGLAPALATDVVLAKFRMHLEDIETGPAVWFALALVQLDQHILQARVREAALGIIADGGGLDRWYDAEPSELAERKHILADLAARLLAAPSSAL
jgi:hypothetical protein